MKHIHNRAYGLLGTALISFFSGVLILVSSQNSYSEFKQYSGIMLCAVGAILFVIRLFLNQSKIQEREIEQIDVNFSSLFTNREAFVVSVTFNLFIASMYFVNLIYPSDPTFLYETALLILILEFISMHATAFFMGKTYPISKKIFLLILYSLFVALVAIGTDNLFLLFFFTISLFSKFCGRVTQRDVAYMTLSLLIFLPSVFIGFTFGDFLSTLFPLPHDLIMARPTSVEGEFADTPQGLMLAGVLYFSLISLMQILLYKKSVTNTLIRTFKK